MSETQELIAAVQAVGVTVEELLAVCQEVRRWVMYVVGSVGFVAGLISWQILAEGFKRQFLA